MLKSIIHSLKSRSICYIWYSATEYILLIYKHVTKIDNNRYMYMYKCIYISIYTSIRICVYIYMYNDRYVKSNKVGNARLLN